MKKLLVFIAVATLFSTPRVRANENALFGYTHLLPSPYTVKAGRLIFGTNIILGVTDFLQVGTNVLNDFYQVYNANMKASVFDRKEFAVALTFGWTRYNYRDISPNNPDLLITSLLPGGVVAFGILPNLALFAGGNLNYTSTSLITNNVQTSGYVHGATLQGDLSFAYDQKPRKLGNVLSAGVSYDLNYKIMGFGVSHHWPGFQLGIHYYPNADQYRILPILSGGGSFDL